jgi:hypothetical protein
VSPPHLHTVMFPETTKYPKLVVLLFPGFTYTMLSLPTFATEYPSVPITTTSPQTHRRQAHLLLLNPGLPPVIDPHSKEPGALNGGIPLIGRTFP